MGRPKKQKPQDEAPTAGTIEEAAIEPANQDEIKEKYAELLNTRDSFLAELNAVEAKRRFMVESVGDNIKEEMVRELEAQVHAAHKEMEICEPSTLRTLQGRVAAYHEQVRRLDGMGWDTEISDAKRKLDEYDKTLNKFREENALFMAAWEREEIGEEADPIGDVAVELAESGIADAMPQGARYWYEHPQYNKVLLSVIALSTGGFGIGFRSPMGVVVRFHEAELLLIDDDLEFYTSSGDAQADLNEYAYSLRLVNEDYNEAEEEAHAEEVAAE